MKDERSGSEEIVDGLILTFGSIGLGSLVFKGFIKLIKNFKKK